MRVPSRVGTEMMNARRVFLLGLAGTALGACVPTEMDVVEAPPVPDPTLAFAENYNLFATPFTWLPGGWVEPPTAPGLGVDLDWDAIRANEQLPYTRTHQP